MTDIIELKKSMRREAKALSLSLPVDYRRFADGRICENLLALDAYKNADTVFCFVGAEHEINTRPFLERVLNDGKRLAVPLCVGKGMMEARQIYSLDILVRGAYGIYEPPADCAVIPVDEVGFAVIPCLCADRHGSRLGHGGGYYDILFAKYPDVPSAIICRERLIRDGIPLEPFDHRFPVTVTENGVF